MDNELDALLEKSKPLTITEDKPGFLQRIGIRAKQYTIEIKPFPYGVLLQITDALAHAEELPKEKTIKSLSEFIQRNRKPVENAIAYALNNNSDNEPPQHLYKFMRRNINSGQLIEVFWFIIAQADLGNFTNAISWVTQKLVAKDSKAGQK